jgi:hypothetical protein
MQGFFDLKTPEDLLKKLEREYERLQEYPGDVDTALSFFVTAAHLPEWLLEERGKALKNKMQQRYLILQICDELANRGKHSKGKKHQPVVLHTDYDSYIDRDYIEPGYFEESLHVTLTRAAIKELGMTDQSIDVLSLAARVLEFWRAQPPFKGP